jgi:hypothetical protein
VRGIAARSVISALSSLEPGHRRTPALSSDALVRDDATKRFEQTI